MESVTAGNIQNFIFVVSIIAFLTESIVEIIAKPWVKTYFKGTNKEKTDMLLHLISLFISIILALSFNVSLFTQQTGHFDYIGILICGLVASRGSNYAHNWLDKLPKNQKPKAG